MPIPNVDLLIRNYPTGDPEAVKREIGGKVNAAWITNTCAIRLSAAFNKAGVAIPKGHLGLSTVSGADGRQYAYRVAEMKQWILSKYGQPSVKARGPSTRNEPPATFQSRKGIICFVDCGWTDATGHLDLFDGEKVVGHGYFDKAREVMLWESSPPPVAAVVPTTTTSGVLTGAAAAAPTAGAAPRKGRISVETANIRALPSTQSAIVGKLARNASVDVLESQSGFYRVGTGRWVHASLVQIP